MTSTPGYCAFCGHPAEPAIERGSEAFCSEGHAEEFAREVAAIRDPKRGRR